MSTIQINLPDEVMAQVREIAQRRHQAVESVIVDSVVAYTDARIAFEKAKERGRQVTRERFLEILRKAPDAPPVPGDELPEDMK